MDDNGGSSANGTKIQMWDCNGSASSQTWTMASNGTVQINGKCLDITGASYSQRHADRAVGLQRRRPTSSGWR